MRAVLLGLVWGIAAVIRAQGLISIPTADPFPSHSLSVDFQLNSDSRLRSRDSLGLASFVYGISPILSAGVDIRLTGRPITLPNVSLQLCNGKQGAVAVGYENVGVRGFGEQPFVVGTFGSGERRFHLGWTQDDRNEAMAGIDFKIRRNLTLVADGITGSGNFVSAGFQFSISDTWSATLAYMHPNDPQVHSGIFVDIGFVLAPPRPKASSSDSKAP